jgi:mannose-6-phosphate isomerase-like protein (cupin superfamily)
MRPALNSNNSSNAIPSDGSLSHLTLSDSSNHSFDPHVTRVRDWGTVTTLEESDRYRINRIEVSPGESMCMQMHYHRTEHWVVVSGTATVTCGDQELRLIPKQSTYVPMHTKHQVRNSGVIPLVMIEIQNGEYLGEDDIIRL